MNKTYSQKTISDIVDTLFTNYNEYNSGQENNIKDIRKLLYQNLKNINLNKVIEPELYISVPIIQALSYPIDNTELQNLYINLLTKSMISDTKDLVHPSFAEIAKQMSPIDIKVLKEISLVSRFPIVTINIDEFQDEIEKESHLGLPILYDIPIKEYEINNITYCDFSSYTSISLSIDNLLRMHLVEELELVNDIHIPDIIKNSIHYKECINKLEEYIKNPKCHYEESYKYLILTSYGQVFYDICLKE